MLKENLNTHIKANIEEIINYLDIFFNEVSKNYKIDAEELSKKLGFEILFFNLDGFSLKSYLRYTEDGFVIGVNDKLDEYNKNFQIYKEMIAYFIIRYYYKDEIIDKNDCESDFYFHDARSDFKSEVDYITEYYSCQFLEKCCYDKKSIKTNDNNMKKIKKKMLKMVKNK